MTNKLIILVHLFGLATFSSFFHFYSPIIHLAEETNTLAACELRIDDLVIGDCVYDAANNQSSKVIVTVFVSWQDMNAGDMIVCDLQGRQEFIDPFDLSCPHFISYILDADASVLNLELRTTSGNCMVANQQVVLPDNCDPPSCQSGLSTGGVIYADYNSNGTRDFSENGLVDIPISIYGNNQLLAQTVSGTNGAWSTNAIGPGQPVRVEFDVPAGLFDGGPGAQSHTRVQIAQTGQCDLDLGILSTRAFVDPDPWIATTCFAKGAILDSNSQAALEPTIVLNKYFTSEGGPRVGPDGNFYVANAYETGSVWGLAYQRQTFTLYSAAFLKRQAALGPHGLGAIYYTSLSDFFPNPPPSANYRYFGRSKLLLDLDDFGIATGDELSIMRDLPSTPNAFSHDSDVFDLVGKWGLGDMDINEKGDTLYVVNLYTKSLIVIDIGQPLRLPITADRITEIPIPDPGCSDTDDWRPWGLKVHEGKVYVGGVCSAESSQDADDLWAYVMTWTPSGFSPLLDFNLGYPKGPAAGAYCKNFKPWSPDFATYKIINDVICGPSPLLSDIEFDAQGHMILGLGDRFGYQTGGRDYGPDENDKLGYISFTAGDILRLHRSKHRYILEKNATSGFITSAGAGNNQGVCGGEFYYEDAFFGHQESILGALAMHPSYNTVLSTIMDPASIWSNGWSQFDNANGRKKVNYSIFAGEIGTFGKAAGLGDIELMVGSSIDAGVKVAIGNYIWYDDDQDGIQDAIEPPVVDLEVVLYDENGIELESTTTDNKGLYYFLEIQPNTPYYIVLGRRADYDNNSLLLNSIRYNPTALYSRSGFGNEQNDSNGELLRVNALASIDGLIGLTYITGQNNENDFSLDIGLTQCLDIGSYAMTLDVCAGDSVRFMNRWYGDQDLMDTIVLSGQARFGCDSMIFVSVNPLPRTFATLDTAICRGQTIQIGGVDFNETRPQGEVVFEGASALGCDSLLQVQLDFLEWKEGRLDTQICVGGQVVISGEVFDENRTSGEIILAGAGSNGCDSILDVSLGFLQETEYVLDSSICRGGQVVISGEIFDENRTAGTVRLSGANRFGCDSNVVVQLSILESTTGAIDSMLCPGEQLDVHGEIFDRHRLGGWVAYEGGNAQGCDSMIEVNITYPSNNLDIQPEYEIFYGDSVRLEPYWDHDFVSLEWTPDRDLDCNVCAFPWADPLETTDYFLSGIDQYGCPYTTKTRVIVKKVRRVWAPNVFTPNGDGINDFFTVYANPFLEIVEELLIFDRWGELVARFNDINHSVDPEGWNGNLNGEPMNPAVFVYVAHVRWKDGERQMLVGDVTLVR